MLQVGASRRTDDLILASSAKNSPTLFISSGSKVDAREVEHCNLLDIGSSQRSESNLQEGIEWELRRSEMILEHPETATIKGTTIVICLTYIWPITHTNRWDVQPRNRSGIPPVGSTEE